MKRICARFAALLAVIALCLTGADRKPYGPHEKAFYAEATTVDFVRPGLTITVNSAQIASDGTITVVYTLTDPAGLPLDASGVTTPGPVTVNYVAAALSSSNDYTTYTTYTTRVQTGAAG